MKYIINYDESNLITKIKTLCSILIIFIHIQYSKVIFYNYNNLIFDFIEGIFEFFISEIIARSAVPLFFIISGMLLFNKEFDFYTNLKKKIKSLLIPYIFFNLLWLIVFFVSQKIPGLSSMFNNPDNDFSNFTFFSYIDCFLAIKRTSPLVYPLWFIKDLFLLNVLAKLIKYLIDKSEFIYFVVLLILWMFNIDCSIIHVQSILFFSLGYFLVKNNYHLNKINLSNKQIIPYIILSVIYIVLIAFLKNEIIPIKNVIVLYGILVLITVSQKINFNSSISKILSQNAFFIFMFHEWNLYFLKKLGYIILGETYYTKFILYITIPFIIIILGNFIAEFSKKYCNNFYRIIVGNR